MLSDDPLLFDFDYGDDDEEEDEEEDAFYQSSLRKSDSMASEHAKTDANTTEPDALSEKLEVMKLRDEVWRLRAELQQLKDAALPEMEELRKLALSDENTVVKVAPPSVPKPPEAQKEEKKQNEVDENYFDSYSWFGIHRDMLADHPRTSAYQQAIEENASSLFKTDSTRDVKVLDVGCGTSILSLFCARAGAAKVR